MFTSQCITLETLHVAEVEHVYYVIHLCLGVGATAAAQVSLHLTASLGELAIFVSGRTTDVWWPPEVAIACYLNTQYSWQDSWLAYRSAVS